MKRPVVPQQNIQRLHHPFPLVRAAKIERLQHKLIAPGRLHPIQKNLICRHIASVIQPKQVLALLHPAIDPRDIRLGIFPGIIPENRITHAPLIPQRPAKHTRNRLPLNLADQIEKTDLKPRSNRPTHPQPRPRRNGNRTPRQRILSYEQRLIGTLDIIEIVHNTPIAHIGHLSQTDQSLIRMNPNNNVTRQMSSLTHRCNGSQINTRDLHNSLLWSIPAKVCKTPPKGHLLVYKFNPLQMTVQFAARLMKMRKVSHSYLYHPLRYKLLPSQ